MICGLCTPPPETIRSPRAVRRLRTPIAMVAAVSTVAVAIRSRSGRPVRLQPRHELRAVLLAPRALGRLAAVIGVAPAARPAACRSPCPMPRCARRGRRSACPSVNSRASASITMLPGPVSNAITSSGAAPGGITVILAMPPIFSAMRVRFAMTEQQVIDDTAPAARPVRRRRYRARGNSKPPARPCAPRAPPARRLQRVGAALRGRWSGRGSRSAPPGRSASPRAAPRARRVPPAGNSAARSRAVCVAAFGDRRESPARTAFGIGGRLKPDRSPPRGPRIVHDRHVDAVERRPAHDAGYSHGRFSSFCNSLSSCSASMGRSSSRFSPRMRSAMP